MADVRSRVAPEVPTPRRTRRGARLAGVLLAAVALAGCQLAPTALRGTVTTDAGSNAGGVVVSVFSNDAETLVVETETDVLGGFQFRDGGLPAGTYRVRIGDRWWPDADTWADATPVQVTGDPITAADLALASVARLTGVVVDDDGFPVANVLVAATPIDGDSAVASVLTGADGTFTLGLLERGEHRLALADLNDPATAVALPLGGADEPVVASTAEADDVDLGWFDVATGRSVEHPGPKVVLTYEPTDDARYCGAVVSVRGFEPNRDYGVTMNLVSVAVPYTDTHKRPLETGPSGAFSGRVLVYYQFIENTFTAVVDGVASEPVRVAC